MRVVLQTDLVVQKTETNEPGDVLVVRVGAHSIIRNKAGRGTDAGPVFRSESGGGLMTLPGGILLALDPEWDRDAVEGFFSRIGISKDRTSELGFLANGFLVETEPGFPSLELAKRTCCPGRSAVRQPPTGGGRWRRGERAAGPDRGGFTSHRSAVYTGTTVPVADAAVKSLDAVECWKVILSGGLYVVSVSRPETRAGPGCRRPTTTANYLSNATKPAPGVIGRWAYRPRR